MKATLALREKAAQLLAADAATLAPAVDKNVIRLIKAPFTPGEGLDISSLVFADFDGGDPIEGVAGTQPESLDPNTRDAIIDIEPPAGGYRWETSGVTNLPQVIYGFALLNNDSTVLFAAELLQSAVTLNDVNQSVFLPRTALRLLAGSLT